MMTKLRSLTLAIVLVLSASYQASAQLVLITNFGNSADNGGGWTYTAGTSTLTGVESAGDLIFNPSTLNIDGTDGFAISITANVTTAPNAGFSFILQDAQGQEATALFAWTSFIGGATIQSLILPANIQPNFDFDQIAGWNLVGNGGGTISAVLTSASLAVIPEPSTYALLLIGGAALVVLRRRQANMA
jgi:hypothetical protein